MLILGRTLIFLALNHGAEAGLESLAVTWEWAEPAEGKETSPSEVWKLARGAESFSV